MKRMINVTVAAMIVAAMASLSFAANTITFSTSNTNPTAGSTPTYNAITGAGSNKTIYVWVTSDVGSDITPPDTGFTTVVIAGQNNSIPNSSAGISFSAARTAGTNITLTGGQALNAALAGSTPSTTIWDSVSNFGAGNANVTAALVKDVNAVVVPAASPAGINRGFALTQSAPGVTNPNFISGAFLLGSVTYSTTAYGTATLTLQPSTIGINRGLVLPTYTFGTATINVVQLPGDATGDALVNLADLNGVLNNFGSNSPAGDAAGNGPPVGLSDLNAVLNNFGTGSGQIAAVPEPSTFGLLAIGGLAFLGRRKFRRS